MTNVLWFPGKALCFRVMFRGFDPSWWLELKNVYHQASACFSANDLKTTPDLSCCVCVESSQAIHAVPDMVHPPISIERFCFTMLSLLAETVSVPFSIPGIISIDDVMVKAALRHDLVSRYLLPPACRYSKEKAKRDAYSSRVMM